MRSILRSTLLASFALTMTWGLSGCEDATKPADETTPPAVTTEPAPGEPKMEPKMEPAPAAPTAPAETPAEPK